MSLKREIRDLIYDDELKATAKLGRIDDLLDGLDEEDEEEDEEEEDDEEEE